MKLFPNAKSINNSSPCVDESSGIQIHPIFPALNIAGGRFCSAPTPASAHFWLIRMCSIKSTGIQKRDKTMWKSADIIVWRAIFRSQVWNALPVIVVNDTPKEIVLTLLPGAECMTETDYAKGKKNGKRRWDFKDDYWKLEKYSWRTNRLLIILEPEKYYSTIYFWNGATNKF